MQYSLNKMQCLIAMVTKILYCKFQQNHWNGFEIQKQEQMTSFFNIEFVYANKNKMKGTH